MNPNRSLHKLLRIIFSEVLMEYFDISGWHDDSSKIEVWLDEKNYMERFDYKSGTVISSGFIDEKVIQDFPLRGKPVYLHVVSNYGSVVILGGLSLVNSLHAYTFASLKRKKLISTTPLNDALNALILALNASAAAFVLLFTKKFRILS